MNFGFKNKLGLKLAGLKLACGAFVSALLGSTAVLAAGGLADDWQLGFQESVTPIMEQINEFHNLLLIIITVITLFVTALLFYVIVRFNEKANPVASKTTHSTSLEFAWTVVPILILLVISIPSWRLLSAQYSFPPADVTIKAIGNQWNWDYEYSDHEDISFTASMKEDNELAEGEPRLLSTDNPIVVPVNKVVHMLVTADPAGVIHNWAVPSFGVKTDAVPGRVVRTWFKATKQGMYYGQCSELCGKDHAFMPIQVKVVSEKEYEKWLQWAKEEYASNDSIDDGVKVAQKKADSKTIAKLAQ